MNLKTKTTVFCAVPVVIGASVIAQAELLRRLTGRIETEYVMLASGGLLLIIGAVYLVAYVARNFDDGGKPEDQV